MTLLLVCFGVLAGLVGTAGGITSLVSYPALLLVGAGALQANVVNLVALVACWPASALVSRRELAAVRPRVLPSVVSSGIGAALGTVLLLRTSVTSFERVVPILVALGSVALLAQGRLEAGVHSIRRPAVGYVLTATAAVYGGYFGAGSGIMLLVVALVFFDPLMPHANALKNMANGGASVVSALILVAAGPVRWGLVGPLAAGLFAGSLLGPVVVRRVPADAVRWIVALLGLGLAADLAVTHWF